MPSGPGERYDFFLSCRGSVAAVAIEVADVLKENGYKVNVEDYDFRYGASLVDSGVLHNSRPDFPSSRLATNPSNTSKSSRPLGV